MRATVTFPKSGEKQGFTPIITSASEVKTRYGGTVVRVPRKAVLVYDRRLVRALLKGASLRREAKLRIPFASTYISSGGRALVAELPIGSPITALVAEDLATMGAKEILILGTAGGLKTPKLGDLVVCSRAVRDEGTSHHYVPNSIYSEPDSSLERALTAELEGTGVAFRVGPSWTVDAPYRESLEELERYSEMGVLTVEMEASALFAVSKVRRVRSAAVFMVSDVLTEKGWSGFLRGNRPSDFAPLVGVYKAFERLQLK